MISESRKAIAAFIVAFLGPLAVLLATNNPIGWREFAAALVAGIIAGFTTWLVPNATKL